MFDQITILGTGLLGGSLAMAAKNRSVCQRVHVWSRRAETRAQAAASDCVDTVFDRADEACHGSDLIVLCTPVDTIVPLLQQIAPAVAPNALITDVGSTKSRICREAVGVSDLKGTFIGSHPMAGSEQTGMAHARETLFDHATCILTPLDEAPAADVARLKSFWQALGMIVTSLSPEKHDEAVAHISHLPHMLASALASYLEQKPDGWKALSGGGLRDSSRIASGDPSLWCQIFEHNREEVIRAIDGFEDELHRLKSSLLNEDNQSLHKQLQRGKQFRDQL